MGRHSLNLSSKPHQHFPRDAEAVTTVDFGSTKGIDPESSRVRPGHRARSVDHL